MIKPNKGLIFTTVLLLFSWGCSNATRQETAHPLTIPSVFTPPETIDAQWQEIYDSIPGNTLEEKREHESTTLDTKAVQEMELYLLEKQLNQVGTRLAEMLANQSLSSTGKDYLQRFLKTHQAWNSYVTRQAYFITDTADGGSMETIIYRSVLKKEILWRIQLYQDILDGKSAAKYDLYFYGCKQDN